jgi:predicted acetyltransferase
MFAPGTFSFMDYRPLPEDREEQFQQYTHYAFRPQAGPTEDYGDPPSERPGDPRALFDGDEMLCVCKHHWFRARFRGQWIEMPGIAAVASPPEHRRQGYVSRLMAESLAEYRERGDFLTALWAFKHPFYERHGWGLANKFVRYECDPAALAFARDHASGQFRRLSADEYDSLNPVIAAHAADYELEIDRTEEWWRDCIFESTRGDPYVYVWEKDGEARGYVGYRISDGDDGRVFQAYEFAHADREARRNLLRFIANHDSQVERASIYAPHDTSLLDAARDPEEIECKIEPGPMVRLVDVPTAFEALEYPADLDASFTVAVEDSLADWNDATFGVTIADGRATCERVVDSSDSPDSLDSSDDPDDPDDPAVTGGASSPDVTTDVSTLSQVYVGYHSVADAEAFGDFDVRDPEAREALAAMFPERGVFLREGF